VIFNLIVKIEEKAGKLYLMIDIIETKNVKTKVK